MKFYIFIRDDVAGMTADCRILNPNGSTFSNWAYTSTANNKTYIKGYSKLLPTISGTYTFQATYNGITCSRNFDIIQATGISDVPGFTQLQLLQNPAGGMFTVYGAGIDNGNYKFRLMNIAGQIVMEQHIKIEDRSVNKSFSVSDFQNGIYFLAIDSEKSRVVKKMVIQN